MSDWIAGNRRAMVALCVLTAVGTACSSRSGSTGMGGGSPGSVGSTSGIPAQGDVGSVGVRLTIGTGVQVNSLNWTISNASNFYSGTISITNDAGISAQSVEFVAGGIVAGSYTIALSGSDSNGDPCSGSTAAGAAVVSAGTTSSAVVLVTCTVPTDAALAADVATGSIAIDAGVFSFCCPPPILCPGISSFAINPAEVLPPQTAALSAVSTDFNGGTETFFWTSSCAGALITNPTSPNATFICGSATGTCLVTLTLNLDGVTASGADAGLVCPGTAAFFEQMSANVVCEPAADACFPPTPDPCPGPEGFVCTNTKTDANNCGNCGTICSSATPACVGGLCSALPPTPCTAAPCASNTIQCEGNTDGACTATEAIFVQQDIDALNLTAGAPDPSNGCYSCLLSEGCLDDQTLRDTGHECGVDPETGTSDLPATFTNGSGTVVNSTTTCLATVQCVVSTGCAAAANGGLTNCFCGPEGGGPSACVTATAVNGPCDGQEVAGFSHVISDPSDIINKDFTDPLEPSGMANQIFSCGKTACPQCVGTCPTACPGPSGSFVCSDMQTDAQNCGACGAVCPAATPSCVDGTCVSTGQSDGGTDASADASGNAGECSGSTPNACPLVDGGSLCTDLQTDPSNCGTCGAICPTATPSCADGLCGPPLTPCTTAPCAANGPNSVQCQGSPDGVCTATEAVFVQFDINAGLATTAGPDPAPGCYSCLVLQGCVDDQTFLDTGHECGVDPETGTSDLPATFTNGSGTVVNSTTTCLATVQCVVSTECAAAANGGLTNCFCGPEGGGPSACVTATAVNGPCDAQEVAGFSHVISDPSDIINKDFTDPLEPSGMANQIFSCGKTACPQCSQ